MEVIQNKQTVFIAAPCKNLTDESDRRTEIVTVSSLQVFTELKSERKKENHSVMMIHSKFK